MSDVSLIDAVKSGELAVLQALSEGAVDINQQDEHGWTPLCWAAGKGDVAVLQLLLERGAEVSKVGRDQRTPYMIALAAGQVEAAKALRAAEEAAAGEKSSRAERQYCKAYQLSALRQFPAWPEQQSNGEVKKSNGANGEDENAGQALGEDEVVFLQHDFTVTRSMWHNEDILFDQVSPEWKEFCVSVLKFSVPDDLDLIVPAANSTPDETAATA